MYRRRKRRSVLPALTAIFLLTVSFIALLRSLPVINGVGDSVSCTGQSDGPGANESDDGLRRPANIGIDANRPAAPAGVTDFDDLPEALLKLYDKVPEARDFVMGCLEEQETPDSSEIDLSGLDLNSVPALYQWDERWGYAMYAGNLLGLSGCGPTVMSMAAIYLTGDTSLNPLAVAEYSTRCGHAVPGNGTAWTLFSDGADGLNLISRELPLSQNAVDSALEDGKLVVLILGPGDFTDTGHFVLLTGLSDNGYTLLDPNTPSNSARTWTYLELEGQIRNLWSLESK